MRRLCSECPNPLPDGSPIHRKTCSNKCRSKRSRRTRRQNVESAKNASDANALSPEHKEVQRRVRGEAPDVASKVIAEELRPVVREAITEDTLAAISSLVGLAPRVVEQIAKDIESDDPSIRQKAYTLAVKYTLGHPALVQPTEDAGGQNLIVHFDLPRPPSPATLEGTAVEDPPEPRQCDMCGEDKTEFVASSDRCTDCYNEQQDRAKQLTEGTSEDVL